MLDQKLHTSTIIGLGDVLRPQPISEAKIIPEFLPRQLRANKAMGYSTKPCPIPQCHMEAIFLLSASLLLPLVQLRYLIDHLPSLANWLALHTHALWPT